MLDLRLKGLRLFDKKPMPTWGSDLSGIDFDNIKYFVRSTEKQATILGRPARRTSRTPTTGSASPRPRSSASSPASPRSTSPRSSTTRSARTSRSRASSSSTPTPALREHEDLFKEYFGTVIPVGDNKFAALNTAVWSGGSFIYVPKGVHVDIPLQAYFRINTENMGQFERTLIIADEGSYVHYVEGCTAPIYSSRLAALRGRRDHREEGRPRAATRRSRTGRTTSTTSSPSGRPAPRARRWSGSTATSAPRSR